MKDNSLGAEGEKEAVKYLRAEKYSIIEKNCRVGGSEIDIIAVKDGFLVFIEVKTRSSEDYGYPEEFVDRRKIKKIISGAKLFSARKKWRDHLIRFDIISLLFAEGKFKIDHIENAFEEPV
ncbi:MAG: YraN family protein [Acidobacteriota bacterium]